MGAISWSNGIAGASEAMRNRVHVPSGTCGKSSAADGKFAVHSNAGIEWKWPSSVKRRPW